MESKNQFYVKITNPEGLVYGGTVKSLSSINDAGPFDILSFHTNFITIIKKNLTLKLDSGEEKQYKLDTGILRVMKNVVDVYLGIEVY